MATNRVVTIARGLGSGGRTMGKMLAEELGWSYYDKELLELASMDSGINESFFVKADEIARRSKLFRSKRNVFDGQTISPASDDFTSGENLFRYQAKVIRSLAETENCVIVGRCANFVLRDMSNVVKVYVHAPEDVCVRRMMRLQGLTQQEASELVQTTDRRRGEYYEYFTGHSWKDADWYDLCLDSSKLGYEKCIALIKSYLENI